MAQGNRVISLEGARDNLERELKRVQKGLRARSRDLEKRLEKGRKQLEKSRKHIETRGRKQIDSLLGDVRKTDAYKRAAALRKDAERQLESGVESLLSLLQIASKGDVARIDRKLRSLNKKLADLEKGGSGSSESRSAASA